MARKTRAKKPYRDEFGRYAKLPAKKLNKRSTSRKATKKHSTTRRKVATKFSSSPASPRVSLHGATFLGERDILGSGVIRRWYEIPFERTRYHKTQKGGSRYDYFMSPEAVSGACEKEAARGETLVRGYANILFRDKDEQWTVCTPTLFAGDRDTASLLVEYTASFLNQYAIQSVISLQLAFENISGEKTGKRNDKQGKAKQKRVKKLRSSGYRELARRKRTPRRNKLPGRKRQGKGRRKTRGK